MHLEPQLRFCTTIDSLAVVVLSAAQESENPVCEWTKSLVIVTSAPPKLRSESERKRLGSRKWEVIREIVLDARSLEEPDDALRMRVLGEILDVAGRGWVICFWTSIRWARLQG